VMRVRTLPPRNAISDAEVLAESYIWGNTGLGLRLAPDYMEILSNG